MNFLEGVIRLRMEAGVSGNPASVVDQVGELEELVSWYAAAYEDIQNLHTNWRFMQREFTFPTIAGVTTYLPTAVSLDELADWVLPDIRCYESVGDENPMCYEPWPEFRAVRDMGTYTSGRPTHFTIKPDNSIMLWPNPDTVFTIRGEYIIRPNVMTANTDVPIFPRQFHMVIVWRALLHYGASLAAQEKIAHGQNEYRRLMRAMEATQRPADKMWEPLL